MHSLDQGPVRRGDVLPHARHNFLLNRQRQAERAAEVKKRQPRKPRGCELAPFHMQSQKSHENGLSDACHVAIGLTPSGL